jgi:hypothetical protein
MAEEAIEHTDDLGRRKALRKGCEVDDVGELNWSAIVRASAFSRSAIERGRMFRSRLSALAWASRRWRANTARSVNTIVPPTATFSPSIVLVNHFGTVGSTPPSNSPARPEPKNTTR